jgi:general secretion pathway protein E
MLGEIRDSETADIALRSALTGHLLLSTLHTNDATSSLSRLMDMGIENFLISSTLLGVLAQRLARKLCVECKDATRLAPVTAKELGIPTDRIYFKSVGCKHCDFTGYKGRQAIGELFVIDDNAKEMMKDGFNDHQVREAMKARGMSTIADKLTDMLLEGTTSYEEAVRVGIMDG